MSKLMLESKLKFSGTQNNSTATVSRARATAHLSGEAVEGFTTAVLR